MSTIPVNQQLRSSDKTDGLSDFVTIYRWVIINQETPFNVQRFEANQCMEYTDFKSFAEAMEWAKSHNLPIVDETQGRHE